MLGAGRRLVPSLDREAARAGSRKFWKLRLFRHRQISLELRWGDALLGAGPISFELGRGRAPHSPAVGFSAWRGDAQFSAVVQVHDGSELVQLSKDPLTQRSPEQHELVTEQCWPAPGQLPA
jgi:hypothetical protein